MKIWKGGAQFPSGRPVRRAAKLNLLLAGASTWLVWRLLLGSKMSGRSFFEAADDFISNVLPDHLRRIAGSYIRDADLGLIVRLFPEDDPVSVCSISDQGLRIFDIKYSTVFAHKMVCMLKLIETHWANYYCKPRLFVFDYDHPFDSHVWDYPRDESYAFSVNPVLEPYLSWQRGHRSKQDFQSFLSDVNSAEVGAFTYIEFAADETLTEEVQETIIDFFSFMVLHELAHIARNHELRLLLWPYRGVSRRTAVAGRIYRYRHKALECDADFGAFYALLKDRIAKSRSWLSVQKLLQSIALGFCLFDSDRRNTFDVKSVDGLYPIPEIRFEILCHLIEHGTERDIRATRDSIVTFCVRSFQGIGLIGPFYLFSGPLSTVDDQFFKEVTILGSVKSEIDKILKQVNVLFMSAGGKTVETERELFPVGMAKEQFVERLGRDSIAMFSRDPSFTDRDEIERRGFNRLKILQEDGTIRSGDHVVLLTDQLDELRPEMKANMKETDY